MISDEPDEDADTLDDEETFLRAAARLDPRRRPADANRAIDLVPWPPRWVPDGGFPLDAATLAWFQANHANWEGEIEALLRGWATRGAHLMPAQAPADLSPDSTEQ